MKVQLLNPAIFYYSGFHYRMLPTLSLPILTAVINDAGHYCEAVDLEALGVHPDQLYEKYKSQKDSWPDVIGITALTITAQGAEEAIKALRKAGFDRKIVVGGVHVTINPQVGLDWGADLVVTGECEGNIVELLESGATGIHAGKPMDIKDIPCADWTHHNPQPTTYTGNMSILRNNPGIVMFSRGCPFKCVFCGDLIFNHTPTKYRPPENIEKEMKDLHRRGCQNVFVYDDELIGTRLPDGWMKDVADRIEPLSIKWVTQGRCSKKHITKDILLDAKRAGCRAVFWGVESFSQPVLDAMHKGITEEDIWHTLYLCKEVGIESGIFTMIGNYKETEADLEYTCQQIKRCYDEDLIEYRQTTVCTTMPGTELYDIQVADGSYIAAPTTGTAMTEAHSPTPYLTVKQIEYWQKRFYETGPLGVMGEPRPKR
jgi:anaerobic magnesium-protoporphyrin IX monomethyl ester cyclase